MQHIKEHNRWQMELTSLDTFIAHDNPVRVIDAFADQLELDQLGFVANQIKSEGRPSYQSKLFLKIYLYGYVNGIRSSRKLERECMRNIETTSPDRSNHILVAAHLQPVRQGRVRGRCC